MSKQKNVVGCGREYWAGIVEKFEGSGLTQRDYCKRNGLSFNAFRNWVYQVRGKAYAQPNRKSARNRFIQVIPSSPQPTVLCKLRVGSAELIFSELPPVAYLGDLLRLMDR